MPVLARWRPPAQNANSSRCKATNRVLATSTLGAAGGGSGKPSGGTPSFLQNPAIAERERLRQFFRAATTEEQLQLVDTRQPLDVGSSLQMLCHTADLAQRGVSPGDEAQQCKLVQALHAPLAISLPSLQPLHLATALWSYAVIGVRQGWMDELLQQVAEQELAASRLKAYSTKELTSLLFAYGRLLRHHSLPVQQYGAALAGELVRRWQELPYIKSSFSSADFADLAQASATLFGSSRGGNAGSSSGSDASSSISEASGSSIDASGSSSSRGPAQVASMQPQQPQQQQPQQRQPQPQQQPQQHPTDQLWSQYQEQQHSGVPPPVTALLEEVAGEVRRQLANKHSQRSAWTPADMVRLAAAYAALGHRTPRATQMLDVLSSFCVQRIRSRHLNCVSRPADLLGLLQAYADLGHATVATPELLAAVGDQVRRGAAQQQEQEDAPAAAAAADEAVAAATPAASSAGGAAALSLQQQQQQQQRQSQEGFSLADITALLDSHLRLGYRPPPLLVQCLVPQIRRRLPYTSAADAAALLALLAEVPLNPGPVVVSLLLGRVMDAAPGGGGSRQHDDLLAGARRAAHELGSSA